MAIPVLGKLWEKVVDKGGDIIKEMVKDKDLAEKLTHEWRSQMSRQEHEFKALELEAEKEMFAAQQQTIQAELQQSDLYTKRTRPLIARRSFYLGTAYVFLASLPEDGLHFALFGYSIFTLMPWSFMWEILLALYSPSLTYMGVRGFEKWKAGGAKT